MFGIILVTLIAWVILELGKNRLFGWILALAALILYLWIRNRFLKGKPFLMRFGGFLGYALALVLIFMVSRPVPQFVPAVANHNPDPSPVVHVEQGDVQGVWNKDHSVAVYAGIPFAKPPVGDLRWKEPQDPEPWEGVLIADHYRAMSMQNVNGPLYNSLYQIFGYRDYRISLDDNYTWPVSEDSLYLNVFKPESADEKTPVFVYIHGGSLQTGEPWFRDYTGENLAKEGVIVVNLTYRLGVFGYYANELLQEESPNGTTGNYGLLDQIKALEWIHDNIASFGGDPDNITICGESAGAASVSAICTSPLAKGLFNKAILESSTMAYPYPQHSYRPLENALEAGKQTMDQLGVSTLEELRAIPAEDLVRLGSVHHHITIDGYALTETPYESYQKGVHNESAILHGFNQDESAPFMLFDNPSVEDYRNILNRMFGEYADEVWELYPASDEKEARKQLETLYTVDWFSYGHYGLNRMALKNEIPVWEYYFTRQNKRLSAWHSGELIYVFRNLSIAPWLFNEDDYKLQDTMTGYWLNFARYGDPNGEGLPHWDQVSDPAQVLELAEEVKVIQDPHTEFYKILDKWQGFEE